MGVAHSFGDDLLFCIGDVCKCGKYASLLEVLFPCPIMFAPKRVTIFLYVKLTCCYLTTHL